MKNIYVKLLLLTICSAFAFVNCTFTTLLYVVLLTLLAFLIEEYVDNKILNIVLFIIFSVLSCFIYQFLFLIPVLMWSLSFTEFNKLQLITVVPLVINASSLKWYNILLICFLFGCGLLIEYEIRMKDIRISMYKKQRDQLAEATQKLQSSINELADRQDAEIMIATLNERNRIAHEIHDSVGHLLSSSIIQIGAIMAVTKDDNTKKNLESVRQTLDKGMNSIRSSIHNIYDNSLDLKKSLDEIVDGFTFCEIQLKYDVSESMPIKMRYAVISIVKEALANVIKHSDATLVTVSVFEHPALYQVIISDNGNTSSNISKDGMGLDSIKNRVDSFKGIYNIDGRKGFKIFISLPKKEDVCDENCNS